uniref:Replication-associated protein n=1 Tax=Cressdnaviricota sp. TaxID=2748378 RepID=A0A890UV39_9VIRU|nr:MAG: replication-associated protein [Cressdnaviricota sp.]
MSFEQSSYFAECLDQGIGSLPLTTIPMQIERELENPSLLQRSMSVTSPKEEQKVRLTSKAPLSLKIPEPWEGSRDSSPIASTWKSCGVPLPKPMLTIPRTTPGTPELALVLPSTESSPTGQDKELAQTLLLLASAYEKVRHLRSSRKRIRPTTFATTTASVPCNPLFSQSPVYADPMDYFRKSGCSGGTDPLVVANVVGRIRFRDDRKCLTFS